MHTALRQVGVVGRIAARRWRTRCALIRSVVIVIALGAASAHAQTTAPDFTLPPPDDRAPILFGGDEAIRWTKGSYEIWVLRGRCYVQQGSTAAEPPLPDAAGDVEPPSAAPAP